MALTQIVPLVGLFPDTPPLLGPKGCVALGAGVLTPGHHRAID